MKIHPIPDSMTPNKPNKSSSFRIAPDVEVFPGEHKIIVAGELKKIEPRVMKVLVYLVRNKGKVVSREEILKEIWEDVIVNDEAVTQSIYQLRKVLGNRRGDKKYIETIPKKGYRFLDAKDSLERTRKKISFRISLSKETLLRPKVAFPILLLVGLFILSKVLISGNTFDKPPIETTRQVQFAMIDDQVIPLDSLQGDYHFKDSVSIRLTTHQNLDSLVIDMEELGRILSTLNMDSLGAVLGNKLD